MGSLSIRKVAERDDGTAPSSRFFADKICDECVREALKCFV